MNTDDLDSADQQNITVDDAADVKHSRRGKLKNALNRTKTKIQHKVKEEQEARRQSKERQRADHSHDADVDDFLSAGRASFSSAQRPLLTPERRPSDEILITPYQSSAASQRPCTSDSRSQPSPRRGPPIAIPRIDVSASSRFPNAKDVHDNTSTTQPDSSARSTGSAQSSSLLKPEYKGRSQSHTSLASGERKARIRGLSVGFADVPPEIIGEGGDEAQAPPVEISRARSRARSASPQGRRPYITPNNQAEARRQMPNRGTSDIGAGTFVPKPFTRVQTSASLEGMAPGPRAPRGPHDDDFMPKPFSRTQTGLASPAVSQTRLSVPPMPMQQQEPSTGLPQLDTGKLDLKKEFEMTLGLTPAGGNSPTASRTPSTAPPIVAPKPQRAPPSYDLIEGGGKKHMLSEQPPGAPQRKAVYADNRVQLTSQQSEVHPDDSTSRPPVAPTQPQEQKLVPAKQQNSHSVYINAPSQRSPPPQQSTPEYYPPPPQRQPTYVFRNIQKLAPFKRGSDEQETGIIKNDGPVPILKAPLNVNTEETDGYQSFAERSKLRTSDGSSNASRVDTSPRANTIRQITDQEYEKSPSNYTGSVGTTPTTATEPSLNKARFYESVNRRDASEGFI